MKQNVAQRSLSAVLLPACACITFVDAEASELGAGMGLFHPLLKAAKMDRRLRARRPPY